MQVVSRQPSDPGLARIQPLSILPVFFDFGPESRAVVAGGTDGAAWKAELLAAPPTRTFMSMPGRTRFPAKWSASSSRDQHHPLQARLGCGVFELGWRMQRWNTGWGRG